MDMQIFEMFGASFIFIMALMTLFWIVGAVKNNAGVVDIGWAFSFCVVVWAYFFIGEGFIIKRLLIALMVSAWSLRLFWYLLKRFDFHQEDPRYTALRERLGKELGRFKMFLMFLFQGFLVIILSIPFAIVSAYGTSTWHPLEGIALLIWCGGFIGEIYADRQLERFKEDPTNAGKVCQVGLWRYSRHPNYFFEWIIWIGYFLFAFPTPWGWLALSAPIIMLILLTRISGIPLAEAQAMKTKGRAYEEYKRKTSSFVPLPSKNFSESK